jgi:hypothetical protein
MKRTSAAEGDLELLVLGIVIHVACTLVLGRVDRIRGRHGLKGQTGDLADGVQVQPVIAFGPAQTGLGILYTIKGPYERYARQKNRQ